MSLLTSAATRFMGGEIDYCVQRGHQVIVELTVDEIPNEHTA